MVLGICGSLVVWCRLCNVDGWSSVTEVRTCKCSGGEILLTNIVKQIISEVEVYDQQKSKYLSGLFRKAKICLGVLGQHHILSLMWVAAGEQQIIQEFELKNKPAKLRRHCSRVHFAKIHFG